MGEAEGKDFVDVMMRYGPCELGDESLRSTRTALLAASEKKADVAEHPEVFDHVGLLVNEPPDSAGLPFIQSSEDIRSMIIEPRASALRLALTHHKGPLPTPRE
jgi:hypothetical protein